jgi:hypothetical protein
MMDVRMNVILCMGDLLGVPPLPVSGKAWGYVLDEWLIRCQLRPVIMAFAVPIIELFLPLILIRPFLWWTIEGWPIFKIT